VVGYPVQSNPTLNDSPTVATGWEAAPPPLPSQQAQWQPQYGEYAAQPTQPAPQPQYAQQPLVISPGSMQRVGVEQQQYPPVPPAQQGNVPVRRKRRVWRRLAITLLILVVLVVGGWFLAARPILHGIAQSQLDQVLSSSVNQILPFPAFVQPPPVAVTENSINNLIVLNHAPSDPVQNAVVHITPPLLASDGSYTGGVRLDFQLYGFACTITGIPMASNGEVVMTHMQVQGILWWVMSPDELTSILNSHFHDAIVRLGHQVTGVTIKNQEIDIQFS
jgi:hypothetical protein